VGREGEFLGLFLNYQLLQLLKLASENEIDVSALYACIYIYIYIVLCFSFSFSFFSFLISFFRFSL
jgi:hypothetical protein